MYEGNSIPKHLGGPGNPLVNISSTVMGKKFIVFDDIYTTGKTLRKFCEHISEYGGIVLGAIVLGITQHDKSYENDICSGYQGLFNFYNENIW